MRYATADEFEAITDLDGASFGMHYSAQDRIDAELDVELDAMLVALDGERIVGASCEVPLPMTVPGDAIVDTVGLTWVSVDVTHRRRGILRGLIERQVREAATRGVPAMILTASEGGIYGRYGFGAATSTRKTVVDRHAARLADPVPDHGVIRMSTEQARDALPARYDRWRRQSPGGLERNAKRWQIQLLDREYQRDGMSGLFHLVHAGGYVSYRIKSDWNDGHPGHLCWLTDYAISTPEAHAGLWQVLLGLDLCATIESYRVPLDDPLPYLLDNPRSVRTTVINDGLWVRPLNVCALLSARTYAVDVDVVLGVRDPLLGDGTYRLRGGRDEASCDRTDARPDVELDVADLGALSLGGVRLAPLAGAGRVRVADPMVLTRLDRAFLADRAPQFGTYF
jgi:predicted acetyltransferase